MIGDRQVNKYSLFHDLERTIASPGNRNQSTRIMANTYVNHWRDAIERPQGLMASARLFARNRLLDLLAQSDQASRELSAISLLSLRFR